MAEPRVVVRIQILQWNQRLHENVAHWTSVAAHDLAWMERLAEQALGHVISRENDGTLLGFPNAQEAMQFALSVQEGLVGEMRARPQAEILHHRLAMDAGEAASEVTAELVAELEAGDIGYTSRVHEWVEGSLWTPPEMGGTRAFCGGTDAVDVFLLRASRPAGPTGSPKGGVPVPAEAAPEEAPEGVRAEVAPADFAAAGKLLAPKRRVVDPSTLTPKRKQPAAGQALQAPDVRFQRIQGDRLSTQAPYPAAFCAVRDAVQRKGWKLTKDDAAAGELGFKSSWLGGRITVCFRLAGMATIVYLGDEDAKKVHPRVRQLVEDLTAAPLPVNAAAVAALGKVQPARE